MMSSFRSHIGQYMSEFIEYRCAQGYSRNTYETILRNLDNFCFTNYPDSINLDHSIVMEWLYRKPKESQSYLSNQASVVRKLGKYMCDKGLSAYIVPEKFIARRKTSTAYIFSAEELTRLFKAIDSAKTTRKNQFMEYELPVIFRLIYTCGLRPQEGRTLKCSNINTETGEILITNTKRNKERMVVMSQDMLELYRQYVEKRNIIYPDSIYAFPNPQGEVYSNTWLRNQFLRCWKVANPGVSQEQIPSARIYDLRHCFASEVLIRWLDGKQNLQTKLPYLQAYMGHCNLWSTAQYIHLIPERLVNSPGVDWDSMNTLIPEVEEC